MIALPDALDEFIKASRADGHSPNTTRWYKAMLEPMAEHWPATSADEITVQEMRGYVIELRTKGSRYRAATNRPEITGGLSVSSVRGHIRAMRRFFTWLIIEYDLEPTANPMLKIRMPSRAKAEPKAIALDDLRKLTFACDYFGIPSDGAHDAYADAAATLSVLRKMAGYDS